MLMALTLGVLFFAYGVRTASMKFAQSGRVSTLRQSLVFITLFSALQVVLLLLTPPYQSLAVDVKFLIYPLGFAVFYSIGYILLLMALSEGPASVTNTILSFNTLVVVAFGIVVWREAVSLWKVVGLTLFVIGLLFYNKGSYSVGGVVQKIRPKWLVHTLGAMLLNGVAVIFTKLSMQQYPMLGKQYLIYYGLFGVAIGVVLILACARSEAKPLIRDRKFLLHTLAAAAAFDVSNYIFVTLINRFSTILFMPLCSVLNMLSILTFGWVVLKERISKSALISSALCLVAIVLLNF